MGTQGMTLVLPVRRTNGRRAAHLPRPVVAFLRVPLVLKLVGANLVIALATVIAAMATYGTTLADSRVVTLLIGALIIAQVVNSALVIIALRPIHLLEEAAARIASGDTRANARGKKVRANGSASASADGNASARARRR